MDWSIGNGYHLGKNKPNRYYFKVQFNFLVRISENKSNELSCVLVFYFNSLGMSPSPDPQLSKIIQKYD